MKVGVYARVSDDKKKSDGERRQDINRQIEMLVGYWKAKGYTEDQINIYADDGKSAYTEDWNSRPQFKALFNDCRRNYVKEILIEDMTRFSRRLDLGLPLLKELAELKCQLISLKEGELEVTSSKGWMQSSMLLMFAEWDSRIKSEKVKSGMQKAKDKGKKIGGRFNTPPAMIEIEENLVANQS
jgi:DNA invertase Pin-like site-specific DNA recombinase